MNEAPDRGASFVIAAMPDVPEIYQAAQLECITPIIAMVLLLPFALQ
jgi:hypothetical protein